MLRVNVDYSFEMDFDDLENNTEFVKVKNLIETEVNDFISAKNRSLKEVKIYYEIVN